MITTSHGHNRPPWVGVTMSAGDGPNHLSTMIMVEVLSTSQVVSLSTRMPSGTPVNDSVTVTVLSCCLEGEGASKGANAMYCGSRRALRDTGRLVVESPSTPRVLEYLFLLDQNFL